MFWQDLDPGYYENPAAYTYLLYGLLRVMYGPLGSLFDLPFGNVTAQFSKDPTQIWEAARTLAAFLCMVGVAATYWAARRLWGVREGLVAAAVLSFAFLPVAYSRVAVTDVGALTGVAVALYGAVRAYEDGRLRDYAIAGAGAGLAGAFKYTAGLALLPLAIAALARLRADRLRVGGRPRARRRGGRGGVRGAQPVRGRVVRRLVGRPARPGPGGLGPAQAGPGGRRRGLLPRQPHLGARLGGRAGRSRGRRDRAAPRPRARPDPGGAPARAVRLPEHPGALLRPLAAAGVPGARHAGRGRARARGRGRAGTAARPRARGPGRPGARAARGGRRAQRARARTRGHPRPGARLARGPLPAGAARGDRARGARALLPLEPLRAAARVARRAAPPRRAGARPGSPTPPRAAGGSAPSTSPASSPVPTAACARRRTTSCSARA